jgi:hypothetical protein
MSHALFNHLQGMEELIRQAFLHVEVIGPHVAEGHYDLIGPNGDIILPQIWDTVVEPDWTVTMHMWPIPEKPKTPEPPPPPPPEEPAVIIVEEPKPPDPPGISIISLSYTAIPANNVLALRIVSSLKSCAQSFAFLGVENR